MLMLLRRPRSQESSRLHARGLSGLAVIGFSVASAASSLLVGVVAALPIDTNLAITGFIFAIMTLVLSQFQISGPRTRLVLYIPKSTSPFSTSIHRGFTEKLDGYTGISASVEWPTTAALRGQTLLQFQLDRLNSREARSVDAIVILPASEDDELWRALAVAARRGVFVIVLDTKAPNKVFNTGMAPRPMFVGSDFSVGGRIVGEEVARRMLSDEHLQAIVALGPMNSWPSLERSSQIARILCSKNLHMRTRFVEIPTWDEGTAAELIREAITSIRSATEDPIVVFCANDKVLLKLAHDLYRHDSTETTNVQLIGYDGATLPNGELQASEVEWAVATVDTRPQRQGEVAAELLVSEHLGETPARGSMYVEPQLVPLGTDRVEL